jgi:polysaccharide pyruvyl transferase CsaB
MAARRAEKTQKILLSGYYGFDNIGDEAVLAALVQIFSENIPNVEIAALSANPEKTAAAYGIRAVDRWDRCAVKREMSDAALFCSGGGSLIQDVTSVRSVYYYTSQLAAAQKMGVPTIVLAQGLGPLNTKLGRMMTRNTLKKCRFLSWRDADSLKLAEEIGLGGSNNYLVCDPVLLWQPDLPKKQQRAANGKKIALALRPWRDLQIAEAVHLVELLQNVGYEPLLLPYHQGEDEKLAAEINGKLTRKAEIAVCKTPSEAWETLSGVYMLVGMRLHSLIMAAAQGLPSLAISYDPKVEAFARIAGLPVAGGGAAFTAESVMRQIEAGLPVPQTEDFKQNWEVLLIEIKKLLK